MAVDSSLENFTQAQLEESTRLFRTLLNSKDTRETMLRAIKKATGSVIPEIDAADSVRGDIAVERAERQKLEARIQEKDILERLEKQRAKAMTDNGLSESDMPEVEKLMTAKEDAIPSYSAAAKVYKASKQIAQPTTHQLQPKTWDMPEKDVWAPGIGNRLALNKIALEQAYKAANEFRGNAGKAQ